MTRLRMAQPPRGPRLFMRRNPDKSETTNVPDSVVVLPSVGPKSTVFSNVQRVIVTNWSERTNPFQDKRNRDYYDSMRVDLLLKDRTWQRFNKPKYVLVRGGTVVSSYYAIGAADVDEWPTTSAGSRDAAYDALVEMPYPDV